MHNLKRVTLVNQKLLTFVRIVHFLCVSRHERVEEGIEIGRVCGCLFTYFLLWSKNATKTLRFLASTAKMRGNLDNHVGRRQIDRGIADLGKEDCVQTVGFLEERKDVVTLVLVCLPVDIGSLQAACEYL